MIMFVLVMLRGDIGGSELNMAVFWYTFQILLLQSAMFVGNFPILHCPDLSAM